MLLTFEAWANQQAVNHVNPEGPTVIRPTKLYHKRNLAHLSTPNLKNDAEIMQITIAINRLRTKLIHLFAQRHDDPDFLHVINTLEEINRNLQTALNRRQGIGTFSQKDLEYAVEYTRIAKNSLWLVQKNPFDRKNFINAIDHLGQTHALLLPLAKGIKNIPDDDE